MVKVLMTVFNEIDHDGRVERCADAVVSFGHQVEVHGLDSGKPYAPEGWRATRVRIPGLGRLRMARPFVFWLSFLLLALRRRPDIVHAHDYFMAFPGWLAAKLVGARYVYDAHELIIPWEHEVPPPRLAMRVFYRLERLVVGRADGLVAANADRARLMAEHYRLPAIPIVVQNIPQPPDPVDGTEVTHRFPQLIRDPGIFRIAYSGFLSPAFGLDGFARAVDRLGAGFQFILVGDGPARPMLEDIARSARPGAVVILGRVPRRDLHGILATADAGIIGYGSHSLNEIHCAPNKVFEYAQAGLPSIANENPGLVKILAENGIGVSGTDCVALITEMAARHAEFKAALPGFLVRNSWARQCDALAALYRAVTS